MILFRRILPLVTIIAIIISSDYKSAANVGGLTNTTKYQESAIIDEDNSASDYRRLSIKNLTRCSLMLTSIVDQIIKLYMPESNDICIVTREAMENHCLPLALDEFMKLGTRNIIAISLGARNFDSIKIVYQKPTIYFFMVIKDFSEIVETLINFGSIGGAWNPRGLFIAISKNKEEGFEAMNNLWKYFVYKVIVLILPSKTFDAIEAYAWKPYNPPSNCGSPSIENIIRLGKLGENLIFDKEIDTELGIMPEKFANCPLNISYNIWEPYVYPGDDDQKSALEVTLIETVCDKMEAKVNPNYHELTSIKEPSEAWAGTRIPLASDIEEREVSVTYIQDSLTWFIPCPQKEGLFKLADGLPTSFLIPSMAAVSIAMMSLKLSKKKHFIIWVLASLLEQSVYTVPNKIRGIWACWLLLCLHLSVAYKTALVSRLTNLPTQGVIRSQSELLESGLELGFLVDAEPWFDEEDEVQKKILERYVPCETVSKCYMEIPEGKAVFTDQMYANYLNGQKNETDLIAEKVCQLPIPSLYYKIAMIFAKGHPMFSQFNKYVQYIIEGGFVEYWIENIEETQARIKIVRKKNLPREQKLSFSSVKLGFDILIAGFILSAVIFLCEILYRFKLKNKFS